MSGMVRVGSSALARQARTVYQGHNYAGVMGNKFPQHMQMWLESSTGNHFRHWDRMTPEDVDHAHRAPAMGTWFQNLKWGDYIIVERAKASEDFLDHGIYMGYERGISTYTCYSNPQERGTLWLGRNLMIWVEPELFALEEDNIYVNDMLVYSPDPDRELGEPYIDAAAQQN
eukprot:TRINITY_DN58249_c0_g1_i1.p1 TRINITY_DN58249_c0_g1~~TRINITY_DN58249_c0_g1_i1.p1  ORF type:complete len:172 (+),score=56.00 TRINITY_DN58249_c0_g1_i1:189-704(+)